ncbi:MAG: lysoplasmalogenase [Cyclobacteriaceae bacterium]
MIRILTILYFTVGFVNVLANLFGWSDIIFFTKPLLIPLLIYYLFIFSDGVISLARLLTAAALLFSWVGDLVLLKQENQYYFLGGLAAFLIAQLIYAYALSKASFKKVEFQWKPLLPLMAYGALLMLALVRNSGSLAPAIVVYGLGILAMVSVARLRRWGTNTESYKLAFIGAFLFVISDSILGLDKFVFDIPAGDFFVMVTYIPAQFFLVKGLLSHPA